MMRHPLSKQIAMHAITLEQQINDVKLNNVPLSFNNSNRLSHFCRMQKTIKTHILPASKLHWNVNITVQKNNNPNPDSAFPILQNRSKQMLTYEKKMCMYLSWETNQSTLFIVLVFSDSGD